MFIEARQQGALAGFNNGRSPFLMLKNCVRDLLAISPPPPQPNEAEETPDPLPPCPCCGGRMRIIETFERWMQPRGPPRRPAATGAPP